MLKQTVRAAALAMLMTAGACAPSPVRLVTALPAAEKGQVQLADVEVRISETARASLVKYDEKAAEQRAERKLEPVAATSVAGTIDAGQYATLPMTQMMPLVLKDVLAKRGLMGGRAVKLVVQVDTLKFANAAAAILIGSVDQLAGLVEVRDATSGDKLAEFYVDTINSHGGLLGLAIRGGGVREKLAVEFAGHVADQLVVDPKRKKARV